MKKILISEEPWQTRVAIVIDGELQNIFFWSQSSDHLERSFFKGIATKVLPGIQTAFVDIGQEKSGFLHISEIDRELAISRISEHFEQVESTSHKKEPVPFRQQMDISKILKDGDIVLVQVSKEPIGEKGAKLTTCFTLPGRFIVLMPSIPRIGISKKIENREERNRLRDIVTSKLPEGMGAIIRTCSEGQSEASIDRDITYLTNAWNSIITLEKTAKPKEKLYQDIDIPSQAVRDHLDDDVESVIVNNKETQKKLVTFVKNIAPEYVSRIKLYAGKTPLFEHYNVEKQIEEALCKKVELKSGGSIVIETAEAMTVIDVNTGRYIGRSNLEDTILKTNLEAAHEIVRQLKVRNIGGLIVIDFIDMATHTNRQKLFNFFEKTLKEQDKFQSVLLKISEFGLVQMTRKRSGKSLVQQLAEKCPTCSGLGFIPSIQSECFELLRKIKVDLEANSAEGDIVLSLSPRIFEYLSSTEYPTIFNFEKQFNGKITLQSNSQLIPGQYKIERPK